MRIQWAKSSNIARIAANAIPLIGVFAFGWRVFPILAFYWLETAILGVFTLLKMWTTRMPRQGIGDEVASGTFESTGSMSTAPIDLHPVSDELGTMRRPLPFLGRVFMSVFFCVHFGMFMFVHGVFLFLFLSWSDVVAKSNQPGMNPVDMVQSMLASSPLVPWAVAGLALSHLIAYVTEFLNTDARYRNPQQLMLEPYGRVILMHIAILFGAGFSAFFGQPVWALVLLIVGKTFIDLKSSSAAPPASTTAGSMAGRY